MAVSETGERVVITTRSMDDELYTLAAALFPARPARRLVGRTAEGYLGEVLTIGDADWVVNIDEDAFVVDAVGVMDLIDLMRREGIDYCGVSDGGVIPHRNNSPLVVNPFFNVFHVAAIREQVAACRNTDLPLEGLDTSVLGRRVPTEQLAYVEPFDSLLTWLSQRFRPLYLSARSHEDGITTIVSTPDGRDIVLHTWYSRMFRTDLGQRRRIQARIRQAYETAGKVPPRWPWWTDRVEMRIRMQTLWVGGRQLLRGLVNAVQKARSSTGSN